MIAHNIEEEFWEPEEEELVWSLAPPSLLAAHPEYEENYDPEEREELIEQHLDEKLCDRAAITVVRCGAGRPRAGAGGPPPWCVSNRLGVPGSFS